MRKQTRGLTVVEVLVASFVLGLLGLLTVALFRTGASGWKKLDTQSGLLADYQVLSEKLSREVQRSIFGSASEATGVNGTTLAFLSATDDSGIFSVDPTTMLPQWQKYLVFYYDESSERLFMRELALEPGSPEINAPEPIEDYDAGTGNIEDYRNDGRLLMTHVTRCIFTLDNLMLTIEIEAEKTRYGDKEPETLNMVNSVAFRN